MEAIKYFRALWLELEMFPLIIYCRSNSSGYEQGKLRPLSFTNALLTLIKFISINFVSPCKTEQSYLSTRKSPKKDLMTKFVDDCSLNINCHPTLINPTILPATVYLPKPINESETARMSCPKCESSLCKMKNSYLPIRKQSNKRSMARLAGNDRDSLTVNSVPTSINQMLFYRNMLLPKPVSKSETASTRRFDEEKSPKH